MGCTKFIPNHALTKNTKRGYGTCFPYWGKFCDWVKIEKNNNIGRKNNKFYSLVSSKGQDCVKIFKRPRTYLTV